MLPLSVVKEVKLQVMRCKYRALSRRETCIQHTQDLPALQGSLFQPGFFHSNVNNLSTLHSPWVISLAVKTRSCLLNGLHRVHILGKLYISLFTCEAVNTSPFSVCLCQRSKTCKFPKCNNNRHNKRAVDVSIGDMDIRHWGHKYFKILNLPNCHTSFQVWALTHYTT